MNSNTVSLSIDRSEGNRLLICRDWLSTMISGVPYIKNVPDGMVTVTPISGRKDTLPLNVNTIDEFANISCVGCILIV